MIGLTSCGRLQNKPNSFQQIIFFRECRWAGYMERIQKSLADQTY